MQNLHQIKLNLKSRHDKKKEMSFPMQTYPQMITCLFFLDITWNTTELYYFKPELESHVNVVGKLFYFKHNMSHFHLWVWALRIDYKMFHWTDNISFKRGKWSFKYKVAHKMTTKSSDVTLWIHNNYPMYLSDHLINFLMWKYEVRTL